MKVSEERAAHLIAQAYPLLAAWNCELKRTLTREPTRKPVKVWLDEVAALRAREDGR